MSIWSSVCRTNQDGNYSQTEVGAAETSASAAVLRLLRRTEAAEEAGHHAQAASSGRKLLAAVHKGFFWSDITRMAIRRCSEASCNHLDSVIPACDAKPVEIGHEEQAQVARKVLSEALAGVEEHPQLAWLSEAVYFPDPLAATPLDRTEVRPHAFAGCRVGNAVSAGPSQTAFPINGAAALNPVRSAPQPVVRNQPSFPPPVARQAAAPQQTSSLPSHQIQPSHAVPAPFRGAAPSSTASSLSAALRQPLLAPVAPPPPVPPRDTTEGFVTAAQQLEIDVKRGRCPPSLAASLQTKPSLGLRRNNTPLHQPNNSNATEANNSSSNTVGMGKVLSAAVNPKQQQPGGGAASKSNDDDAHDPSNYPASLLLPDGSLPPILLPLDPKLVTQITYEIMERQCNVDWSDIAGLEFAKSSVEEAIVWPLRRPDLFVGLRDPPKGLLLFGPPGTGKTMIARAIASRAQCTFLNISSSSLMSKWVGDGEKMVRCMFAVAVVMQPSVIFIDEIDSLLSMRGEGEQDGVRRVKTEFLVQLDGVGTSSADRVLLIGATNRPEELDEAARRRLEKRLYIPLPDEPSRKELVRTLLSKGDFMHAIGDAELESIAKMADGYSGADLKNLCREAAMGPLRSAKSILSDVASADIRPVMLKDFNVAVRRVKPSVGQGELERYVKWNNQFGSFIEGEEGEDDDEA